jgi:oxalate decarboxylase/phosphoglucose isomerase-like protein (cupin superfamily)
MKSSGFSLSYDGGKLLSPDLAFNEIVNVTVGEMRPQLLNKDLTSPEIFYCKYKTLDQDGIYAKKHLRNNFYVVPPNLAGIEYIKTKASRMPNYPRLLEVAYGNAVVLMQNFHEEEDGDIIVASMKKNQKIVVPAGYTISIINPRSYVLVMCEIVSIDAREQIILDEMGGMSYYVIRKNAKQEIVRNPMYKSVRRPRRINWENLYKQLNITEKTPLIKQILRKYDKFKWIFEEDSFSI